MNAKRVQWSEVTALFGGTFDPPHLGHIEAIQGLFRCPGVGRVKVIPAALPPLKSCPTPAKIRIRMAEIAFADLADIDDVEIRRFSQSARPSYTADTLEALGSKSGQSNRLAVTIGSDQLADLPRWSRFPELLEMAHWIVLERKGAHAARASLQNLEGSGLLRPSGRSSLEGLPEWLTRTGSSLVIVPTEAPAISSTEIRESIGRTGTCPPDRLPKGVEAYLLEQGLYGIRKT